MRNLVLGVLGICLLFGITTADVAAGEVEDLRAEITKLLVQIKSLEAGPNEVIIESLADVPEFEHVAVGWDGEYPEGNFVYYRPVIWESVGRNNVYGRYDHLFEVLQLDDEVENLVIILDDQVINIRDGETLKKVVWSYPIQGILNSPTQFPEAHDWDTDVLVNDRNLRDHVKYRGFKKALHGFYPKTGHDLVVKVGDTLVGIIFPAERKMERHRQVRLMMLGDGAVSLHGYPEDEVLHGFAYDNVSNFAAIAHTLTEALGYLVISEIIRDLTLLVHETMESVARDRGAPSAHQDPVQSLVQRTQALLSGAVTPEGKKITTWGDLKR